MLRNSTLLSPVDGADFIQVRVHDHGAVERYFDVPSVAEDLLSVPFARGLEIPDLGGNHAIDGSVDLKRF